MQFSVDISRKLAFIITKQILGYDSIGVSSGLQSISIITALEISP